MARKIWKVLMYGSRDWSNKAAIEREFLKMYEKVKTQAPGCEILVIHGGAPGADTLSGIVANENSCHTARVDALWQTRYRGAGPQRNEVMKLLEPDEAIGFHEDIAKSKGTKDMKRRLDAAGIQNRIVRR